MCGIFGLLNKENKGTHPPIPKKKFMHHRGPDAFGEWVSPDKKIYFAHNRLSIIGLEESSNQPMRACDGSVIIFNGEIYNYKDIKQLHLRDYEFKSSSDTEVILGLYEKYGLDCLQYLRGMFAFALWDPSRQRLFCARDRFGIKPFYFTHSEEQLVFASEIKALLPFLTQIQTNEEALSEYITFQYTLGEETLFKGIHQLMPGHFLVLENNQVVIKKYWDVTYKIDYETSEKGFEDKLRSLIEDSVKYHQVSDVPVGSYLSGGIDSSLVTVLASEKNPSFYGAFHGKFVEFPGYDESLYASTTADSIHKPLHSLAITSRDFTDNIQKIIYHLDVPVAGPGSFPNLWSLNLLPNMSKWY